MPNQDAQRSIQNAISVCQELSAQKTKVSKLSKKKQKKREKWSLHYLLYSLLPNIMWQKKNMGFFIHSGIVTDL